MKAKSLKTAIKEAERFLEKAKYALACLDSPRLMPGDNSPNPLNQYGDGYPPANAAAKRASLDLTRALAQMRKP